ncbi:MAG: hypothetical protein WCJ30_03080 [Deltaproteobacteria bacterium]
MRPRDAIDQGYVYEDARHIARQGPPFDRVGYAMRALRMLRPPGLTVVVREGRFGLTVDAGRDWGRGEGSRWAVLSIPPDATREDIAVAVAELAGVSRDAWVLDVLVNAASPT